MNILVRLSPELRGWITHNLERGCVPGDLVNTMVGQQFEPPIAHGVVDAFVRARTAGVDPPDDSVTLDVPVPPYEYETPRLLPGRVIVTTDRTIPVLMRAEQPVLAVLEGVLSPDECDQVIGLARPRLQPSTVVDPQTGVNTVADYRDSEGMFFERCENPLIATLDRRIAQLMNCPLENGEGLQVLRYGQGGHSTPHFDFLVPSNATNVASVHRSGQRISSLVVYLNDVEHGGATVFPEAGLSVTARKGNAVYFEYSNSSGQLDHKSLHAGAPVLAGEKWAMTKWMRARRFVMGSD
jgi:prolyl 4-hydroxylase